MKLTMSLAFALCCIVIFGSCKHKKKEWRNTSNYFPTLSFLQGQVKELETSFKSFTSVATNGSHNDTSFLKREEVRRLATDFLTIPNFSDTNQASNYIESNLFDSLLNRAVLSYVADDEDLEMQKLDVSVISPGTGQDQVKTVYIEKSVSKGDSIVEKKMIWEVGEYFNIRTIVHKKNQPEAVRNLKVYWEGE